MKNLMLSFALMLTGLASAQTTPEEPKKEQVLKFDKLEIVRDSIEYDNKDLFVFEFKNISKKPVTVTHVQTSCGCTAAEKPETAIEPGKKSKISVTYDTKRVGAFTKTITVSTDTGEPVVLTIRGSVKPQPTVPATIGQ